MGATISIAPGRVSVDGPCELRGGDFHVPPGGDEAVTWLIAAAMTGGDITASGIDAADIAAELDALERAGCRVERAQGAVRLWGRACRPLSLTTGPPPAVGSDLQPLFGALATTISGRSVLTDERFTERFAYLDTLRRFGARCQTLNNRATVTGAYPMTAASVRAPDLRGGMAAVLTALVCQGQSRIECFEMVDRGYPAVEDTLTSLGARCRRYSGTSDLA